jgi:predicted transcriptional regulator
MMMYNKPGLIAIADELAGYHVSDDDIADMLEALIAALYDYLSQQMGYRAIEYVHQYLRDEF